MSRHLSLFTVQRADGDCFQKHAKRNMGNVDLPFSRCKLANSRGARSRRFKFLAGN